MTLKKTFKNNVSGTAFLVNVSRTKMLEISRDVYANLWVTPEAIEIWNKFSVEAYPNDGLNLSLRNRFFLDHLDAFIAKNDDPVFVNIASGFTNYPFLLSDKLTTIEIDLPNIIELRKDKVKEFVKNGKLPERKVEFISTDLMDGVQLIKLKKYLDDMVGDRPSFAVMEGLTYYLKKEVLKDIIKILAHVQNKGSLLAFDYWKPDSLEYPVFVHLNKYLSKYFGAESAQWNLFDKKFIEDIDGYAEIESTSNAKLELKYSTTRIFQVRETWIPVFYSVLKKT